MAGTTSEENLGYYDVVFCKVERKDFDRLYSFLENIYNHIEKTENTPFDFYYHDSGSCRYISFMVSPDQELLFCDGCIE